MMKGIRGIIEDRIVTAMEAMGAPEKTNAIVVPASRPEFGDYQANGIMSVAKKLEKNPREFAQAVVDSVELNDIAESKGLKSEELLTEIETIVDSGTKVDLNYYINDILDEYQQEELYLFFKDSDEGAFSEARNEYDEDEYSDEELRLFRIKFISEEAN